MTRDQLKELLWQDVDFVYKNQDCSFCPVQGFWVTYGKDSRQFFDVDAAIDEPMFDGKSLLEVWDDVLY